MTTRAWTIARTAEITSRWTAPVTGLRGHESARVAPGEPLWRHFAHAHADVGMASARKFLTWQLAYLAEVKDVEWDALVI
jgi:thioesterase domain-containing protein